MRDNGTVSGHEIELGDDQIIISRSDNSGRIVYVNSSFVEISGYTEAELLGQPHNLIRHPDMPSEAFADLWADLEAGRPWIGIVKNRCKNGDAYWVEAHISPIWEKGAVSGYMSMRRKPSREQIVDAERNYAAMRERGSQSGLTIKHGTVVGHGLWNSLLGRLSNTSLAAKFILSAVLPAIVVLSTTAYLLTTYLSGELDENARRQQRHEVSLIRAAVAARIENIHGDIGESSKVLARHVSRALGGERMATRAKLEALAGHTDASTGAGEFIDDILRDARGQGTIFIRTPEGFQRRMTMLTDDAGNSVNGTFLAPDHPALPALLAGKPFSGAIYQFGHHHVASYIPILDNKGAVIGATGVGIDITKQLESLKSQIRDLKVGETGYYYIADVTPGPNFGRMILHPYKEGQSLAEALDKTGSNLIAKMVAQGEGEIEYPWQNVEAGETRERIKLVTFEILDNPSWVIVGGSSIDEFSALSHRIVWMVMTGGLVMVAAIFFITLLLLRRLVLKPLNTQVLPTFHAMSEGRFDTPLDVRGNDEIAQGIQGLESLRNRVAFESERERTLSKLHESARQEAESLSRARAEFLANMSHEIRTPLNAVIGLAYLLMQSKLGQREEEYVKRIEGAGKLLLAIVNDILDFSKIDAGRMQLEEAPFRLDDVLDNLSNLLRNRVQEKGLVLEYVVSPSTPQALRGDPLRLSQILINLVSNAIKFTSEGSITVHIDAEPTINGRVELFVRVVDTGIGMSEEQLGNLFRAFSQADSSVTRKFGGTGLGLVISKRLIEMMGGSIGVDSNPQSGSTFGFTVWLGIDTDDHKLPTQSGYRILVVDDNHLARKVMEQLLIKNGCVVHTVDSGEAALAQLRDAGNAPFDCIMVDLNMPDMDGLALAHHIRVIGPKSTKLVMVTGENVHAARYRHALGDFDNIVEKPVTAAHLNEVLTQLQGKGAPPSPEPAAGTAPLAGTRILVAEDIPTNQLIMRDLLESLGATVEIADNGAIAVQQLTALDDKIDLILMDIQMPEMDGLEATRRIRAGQVRNDIPIVALTAHALDEERKRASLAGMNDFLTKPIDPHQMLEVIRLWLPASNLAEATAAVAPPESPPQAEMKTLDLPGIDVEDGLRRMLNRQALFEKILRDFESRFSGETARIREALAANDTTQAKRRAHSMKGTGGMISAKALSERAAALEKAISAESPDVEACLEGFDTELQRVLIGIRTTFGLVAADH